MVEVYWLRPVSDKNMNAIEAALIEIEKRILAAAEKVKELNPILGNTYSLMICLVEPFTDTVEWPKFEWIRAADRDKFKEETWKKVTHHDPEIFDFLKLQTLLVSYNSETGLYSFLVLQGIDPIEPDPVALVVFPELKCYTKRMWDGAERKHEEFLKKNRGRKVEA